MPTLTSFRLEKEMHPLPKKKGKKVHKIMWYLCLATIVRCLSFYEQYSSHCLRTIRTNGEGLKRKKHVIPIAETTQGCLYTKEIAHAHELSAKRLVDSAQTHTLSPDCNTSAEHPSCLFRNRHISVTVTGGSTFCTEVSLPKSEDRAGESSTSLCRDIKEDMTSGVDIILQAAHLLDGPQAARGEENRSHMAGSADMRTIFFPLFILPKHLLFTLH